MRWGEFTKLCKRMLSFVSKYLASLIFFLSCRSPFLIESSLLSQSSTLSPSPRLRSSSSTLRLFLVGCLFDVVHDVAVVVGVSHCCSWVSKLKWQEHRLVKCYMYTYYTLKVRIVIIMTGCKVFCTGGWRTSGNCMPMTMISR